MTFLAMLFAGVLGYESAIDVGTANASPNSVRTITQRLNGLCNWREVFCLGQGS